MAAPWINSARIRRQAIALGVCLWLAYAFDLATPTLIDRAAHLKGADFLHAYVLGSLANEHRPEALYDAAAQIQEGLKLVPASKDFWFVPIYPPQYSLLFAPLARLPYAWAFVLWSLITAAIYGLCCYWIWKSCPNLRFGSTVILLAIAFPGFVTLVMFGQNSAIALGALTLMYFALRSRRLFLAGLALGLLAYKPPLGIVAAAVFLFTLEWKVIAGAIASIAAQIGIVIAYYGAAVLRDYWQALTHLSRFASILEPKPYLIHSLRGFWRMLLPWPAVATALYIASAAFVVVVTIYSWRRFNCTPVTFTVLVIATVLVAPHLTVYDLVVMAPALLLAADWLIGNPAHRLEAPIRWLLYLSYWVPLLGPLALITHFQLSVPVFAGLLVCLALSLTQKYQQPEARAVQLIRL